jgi:hypothetical protein
MFVEDEEAPLPRSRAMLIWGVCCAALLAPSLLVWSVRGTAYALHCAPGPQLCSGMTLGAGLRDALELAWALPMNSLLLLIIAFTAAIAAVCARRVLLGAITLIAVPIIALILPMIAVFASTYENCQVNEGGVGDCPLWGANMGMAFHQAANVNDLVYGFAPYTFAAALMLGVLGWFFTRPRAPRAGMAGAMRMPERRPPDGGRLDQ